MFCFETCIKLCYWCEHIYYYDEQGCEMRLPLEQLMKLYDLEHLEVSEKEMVIITFLVTKVVLQCTRRGSAWC